MVNHVRGCHYGKPVCYNTKWVVTVPSDARFLWVGSYAWCSLRMLDRVQYWFWATVGYESVCRGDHFPIG